MRDPFPVPGEPSRLLDREPRLAGTGRTGDLQSTLVAQDAQDAGLVARHLVDGLLVLLGDRQQAGLARRHSPHRPHGPGVVAGWKAHRCRPRLRRVATSAQSKANVAFPGQVTDQEELRQTYGTAVASVGPGSVGLSITQSLWFGVPMIVAASERHGPEIEAAVAGDTALFFRSDCASDLTRRLSEMWTRRLQWGQRADELARRCREEYSSRSPSRASPRRGCPLVGLLVVDTGIVARLEVILVVVRLAVVVLLVRESGFVADVSFDVAGLVAAGSAAVAAAAEAGAPD